jgi:hypothetical protein
MMRQIGSKSGPKRIYRKRSKRECSRRKKTKEDRYKRGPITTTTIKGAMAELNGKRKKKIPIRV